MNFDVVYSNKKPKNALAGMEKLVIEKALRYGTPLIIKENGKIKEVSAKKMIAKRNGKIK